MLGDSDDDVRVVPKSCIAGKVRFGIKRIEKVTDGCLDESLIFRRPGVRRVEEGLQGVDQLKGEG